MGSPDTAFRVYRNWFIIASLFEAQNREDSSNERSGYAYIRRLDAAFDLATEPASGPGWPAYLDALSGIAVVALGHAHPEVAGTISKQAGAVIHTSNLYNIPAQTELAERLTKIADMDNAFFANSGAEANECAIKIARLYGRNRGIEAPTIIVADASFHGRTLATLTASGSRKSRQALSR